MGETQDFDALVVEITRGVTRFALGLGPDHGDGRPVLGHYHKVITNDFNDIISLLNHYREKQLGGGAMPSTLAISHAGPQIGDRIIIPGSSFSFTIADIERAFSFDHIVHANDCVALGSALPWLDHADVAGLSSTDRPFSQRPGRYGLMVPSQGLGVGSIIHGGETIQVIDSEGGHANFAPCSDWHADFAASMFARGQVPSYGDVISYPGLEAMYAFIAGKDDDHAPDLRAQEILLYARTEADETCIKAIRYLAEALGGMAGDIALMVGAVDGMFLVSPLVNEVLDIGMGMENSIRQKFEAKNDFGLYMQRIPLYLITHRRASMIGVLRLACRAKRDAALAAA